MIARLQQAIVAAMVAGAVAWIAWCVAHDRPVMAVVGAGVILAGHALFLAVEFAWMHAVNAGDPAPRAGALSVVRSWAAESLHAPRVFLWRQPFRAARWPDRVDVRDAGDTVASESDRGVLLIHGFVCNRGLWNRWLARLTGRGTPFIALTMEPPFGRIDDYAIAIDAAVGRLEQATGRAPIVVAHSMGGLALRRWWSEAGNAARIHHAITIGTPHHGTRLARFALSPNGRQMREHSAWLRDLRARESPACAARTTCFYSHTDNIVFPAGTATLPGADHRHLAGTPHVAMVDHPAPWAELQRRLRT